MFFGAIKGIARREPDEDQEKEEGRAEDDLVDLVVVLQVHEEKDDEAGLDRCHQHRNDDVPYAVIVIGDLHRDDGEDEEAYPYRDVGLLVIVLVRAVRHCYPIKYNSGNK